MHAVFGTLKLPGGAVLNSLAVAHAGRCRFFASNNPKATSCKSDKAIEAARASRLEIKSCFLKIFNTSGKIANVFE